MSDGITDSYRDQERGESYRAFLKILADFLEQPDQEAWELVQKAAASVDSVPRGLMTGKTNLADGLGIMVNKLQDNDERAWAQLLLSAADSYPADAFNKLKSLSPFKDKILVSVNYGFGFVVLKGELESALGRFIAQSKGLKTYDADQYLVALDYSAFENAKLVWLKCGVYGVKGPRNANEPSQNPLDDDD